MNAAQYKIVKTLTGLPLFNTNKFAKMIKLDHTEVLRVQRTNSFEQYQSDDTSVEDLMGSLFGDNNPFAGGEK